MSGRPRLAVVLFNLGGPDRPEAVEPFLRNLFSDKAIIGLPGVLRLPLAFIIAAARKRSAGAAYDRMGGASPLLAGTEAQAAALRAELALRLPEYESEVFIAMRYWRPFTRETARQVAAFAPEEVVLLPLYPQYSSTTTGSSLKAWRKAYRGPGEVRAICCYPDDEGLVEAHAEAIVESWRAAGSPEPIRLLFSAHGLPKVVIDRGDPYADHVQRTCEAIVGRLGSGFDWRICYQSRVGPMEWIGPSTEHEVDAAAKEGLSIIVCPVAFVSEHVETLVELDIDYAERARAAGARTYIRAATPMTSPFFIAGLSDMVARAFARPGVTPGGAGCAGNPALCACALEPGAEDD